MGNVILFLFLFVGALCNSAKGLHFPDKFKRCHGNSGMEINRCLQVAIQDGLRLLKHGLPSFKLPRLEPIDIPSLTIGQGTGTVKVVQKYQNVEIHGISTTRIDKVEFIQGPTGNKMIIDGFIKEILLEGDYSIDGYLIIQIHGEGKCTIKLLNLTVAITAPTKHYTQNGTLYTHIEDFIIKLAPQKVEFNFENLFGGNEALGKQMNNILNDQWEEVFSDVQSGYEEALGLIFKNMSNLIYSQTPLNDLHPL